MCSYRYDLLPIILSFRSLKKLVSRCLIGLQVKYPYSFPPFCFSRGFLFLGIRDFFGLPMVLFLASYMLEPNATIPTLPISSLPGLWWLHVCKYLSFVALVICPSVP
ncbi:hypothetical protein PRUPE_4G267300 [Prunus persica]|uniref:Uncharacterized protein n=1 Tax=Prunus persica TaxID=3760 RepID=A0A251PSX3_PRUPE|nr:hypothetical protein PRUPE_4G267300 [Prunus persica]